MGYLYSKFTRYCCSGGGNSSKNQNQAIKNTEGHGLKRIATGMRSEKLGWPSTLLISFWRLHSYFGAQSTKLNLFWQETKRRRRTTLPNINYLNFLRKCLANSICLLISATSPCNGPPLWKFTVLPLRRSNVVTKARNKILATKLWHKNA